MHIILNNQSMVPIYEQLMEQIKNEIVTGQLQSDTLRPSVRTFANELKISALTVKKAYDKLEEDGFVVTVHGKGTYVAQLDTGLAEEARRKAVEEDFVTAIAKARMTGMSSDEIRATVEILLEE